MANLPSNLPVLLREAGLTVKTVRGWKTRGRSGQFNPVGVLNHHTGASASGWTKAKELIYAKWMFLTGRSDLPAPLCQIALGRSGTVYIGAAGRANHAGKAKMSGSVLAGDGNAMYIGIEWMLSGTETIPAVMRKAGTVLNAVLTEKVTKTSVQTISCHYQTSVTGKWDIGDPDGVPFKGSKVLDVDKFRTDVQSTRIDLYRKPPVTTPTKPPMSSKPKKQRRGWSSFVHLSPLKFMNYWAGIIKAANRVAGRAIDIDVRPDANGALWGLHWDEVGKNHLHDPLKKIKPSARISRLTTAEVKRLRGPNGQRPRRLLPLLRRAANRGVRVEVEMKALIPPVRIAKILKRPKIAKMHKRGDLQWKTLAAMPNAGAKMRAAHAAGGTTLLSWTKYKGKGLSKSLWGYIDYERGKSKWI